VLIIYTRRAIWEQCVVRRAAVRMISMHGVLLHSNSSSSHVQRCFAFSPIDFMLCLWKIRLRLCQFYSVRKIARKYTERSLTTSCAKYTRSDITFHRIEWIL
ncbi:hypothetical protein PFISCL1PPCAC_8520, partial [Pristionchus fissidentatus]